MHKNLQFVSKNKDNILLPLSDYHASLMSWWRFALLWTLLINRPQSVTNLRNKFHTGFMATTTTNEHKLHVNVKHESRETDVDRAVVKRMPLTPPNVESATNTGIIHAMKPYMRWANVCHTHIQTHHYLIQDGLWRMHFYKWPSTRPPQKVRLCHYMLTGLVMTLTFDLWTWKTFSAMPTYVVNICGKFCLNSFTKYKDMTITCQCLQCYFSYGTPVSPWSKFTSVSACHLTMWPHMGLLGPGPGTQVLRPFSYSMSFSLCGG